jgi:hypothetical protein
VKRTILTLTALLLAPLLALRATWPINQSAAPGSKATISGDK